MAIDRFMHRTVILEFDFPSSAPQQRTFSLDNDSGDIGNALTTRLGMRILRLLRLKAWHRVRCHPRGTDFAFIVVRGSLQGETNLTH